MVNALKNVTNATGVLVENHAIGVIDVAAAVRLGAEKGAGDLKLARYGAHVMF